MNDNFTDDLMAQFTAAEKALLVEKRPFGRPNSVYRELYERRDKAIVALFLELSKDRPQTKRHTYYMAKAIGLCGVDPSNKDPYHSTLVREAILAANWDGRIPWDSIVDDSRTLDVPLFWKDASTAVEFVKREFAIDLGVGQKTRIMVCTEKDAVIESVHDICEREHIPSMSFHGQCNDAGIHKLACHIAQWKCDRVEIAYLGDFDSAGVVIDERVFGVGGKLQDMLNKFFTDAYQNGKPIHARHSVRGTRIGMTAEDLANPLYTQFVLTAKEDKSFFPSFKELRKGDLRTIGIDVLSTEGIEARLEAFIAQFKDPIAWARREKLYRSEVKKLDKMISQPK